MNQSLFDDLKYRIKNYIQGYKSNVFISSYIIDIQVIIENIKISITIPTNNNWEEITKRIDIQLQSLSNDSFSSELNRPENNILFDCPICENQKDINIISCNKCAKKWCNLCYINMVQKNIENDQTFSCPFCRFCFEGEIPTFILRK